MDRWERVWYLLLYCYVAYGLGYYLKRGFNEYQYQKLSEVKLIGILEKIPAEIDYLFTETGIPQIEEIV